MSNPLPSALHTDQYLSGVAHAFIQGDDKFFAHQAAPLFASQKKSDKFPVHDLGDWQRDDAKVRSQNSESVGGGWSLSDTTFECVRYAYHKANSDEVYANADDIFEIDFEATQFATRKILIRQDAVFTSTALANSVWDIDEDGVTGTPSTNQFKQFDQSGSTPIDEIRGKALTMEENSSYRGNFALSHPQTAKVLRLHADIKAYMQPTSSRVASNEDLAAILGLDQFVEGRSIYTTSNEAATDATSYRMDQDLLLLYQDPNATKYTPTAIRGFYWSGLQGQAEQGVSVSRIEEPSKKSIKIEAESCFVYTIAASALGAFFDAATAVS